MNKSYIAFLSSGLCAFTLAIASPQEIEFPSQTKATESRTLPQTPEKDCKQEGLIYPQPTHTAVRYTTPRGIGYNPGYTTLEGFFASTRWLKQSWVPFLDVRGHVFDNGKWAANAGLGARYLSQKRVWGVNAYYDYRNTHRQHYNQFAMGLETLGKVWDFRINGYLPLGWKRSPYFHTRFSHFENHLLFIRRSKDYAMKGANAEAGLHVNNFKKAPLYLAGGPYYLTGKGETTWGGELRARVELFDRFLKLEASTSYDHFFKWIGQARISINVAFGDKCRPVPKEGQSCSLANALCTRAMQPVDRIEIIPVGRQHIARPAIDPATGLPWFAWFVNNTSSSLGTFESPFPTLVLAQNASSPNQIIYVFPGDGATTGMNAGIALQENQLLLGASVAHPIPTTVGTIVIPPMASRLPQITNTAGDVVSLSNSNTVSGFHIATAMDGNNGLDGTAISNLVATHNAFVTVAGQTTNGIGLVNSTGSIEIKKSSFTGFSNANGSDDGNAIYVQLDGGYTLNNLNISRNSFSDITHPSGGDGGNAVLFNGSGTIATCHFSNNTLNNFDVDTAGIFNEIAIGTLNFTNNTFDTFFQAIGLYNFNTITTLNSANNAFNNFSAFISVFYNTGAMTNFNSSNDAFSNLDNSAGIRNLSTITALNVSNGSFDNLIDGSFGILNDSGGEIDICSISQCSFSNIDATSRGINYTAAPTTLSLEILNNFFSPSGAPSLGYGTFVQVNNAATNLCLEFAGNTAFSTTPDAYRFVQGMGGTFNLTPDSTDANNIGGISPSGSFGTCTLP